MENSGMSESKLICGDSAIVLSQIENESIDLTITSPPYDEIRDYDGYTFSFDVIARQLYRITKEGGVVVWIVNDQVKNGSESGTSFKQVLFFREIGFNLHDTMIWAKDSTAYPDPLRYAQTFEYMFVLSKGKPKTVNKIKDRENKHFGELITSTERQKDGSLRKSNGAIKKRTIYEYGERFNVWRISAEKNNRTGHPAVFPIQLAKDHIITWSEKNDVVLDPFMGSGTTGVACYETQRKFIGIEISNKYFQKAKNRIEEAESQIQIEI